jgi:hypothetical protein
MPAKRRFIASLDQVKITRQGDTAIIEYADPRVGATHLKLDAAMRRMSDQQILDIFNEGLAARERLADQYEHIAVEIPIGKPQIEYQSHGQWTPRGAVLRCLIGDKGDEPVIEIDGRELSWEAFGRLMTTYSGWGARIIFVPDDETHLEPKIEVGEPDERGR